MVLIQAVVSAWPSGRCLSRTRTCHASPGCCLRSVGCFPGQKVPNPCSQGRGLDPVTHDVQIVALAGAPSRSRLRPLLFRLRVRPTQLSPAARVCSSWPPLPLLRAPAALSRPASSKATAPSPCLLHLLSSSTGRRAWASSSLDISGAPLGPPLQGLKARCEHPPCALGQMSLWTCSLFFLPVNLAIYPGFAVL